jgi:hypothetical protein
MEPFGPDDAELAVRLYQAEPTLASRAFLDLLIAHPGEQFDSDAVQQRLGLEDHRDVARTTYALGEVAEAMNRKRPWNEGQRGYAMPPEIAALFPAG